MRKFEDCQFAFPQFGEYLQNMHNDLVAIKKYYCSYFNKNSKIDIDTYIKNFDSYVDLIKLVLYDKQKYQNWKEKNENCDNCMIYARLFKDNVATFDYCKADTDFYESRNTVVCFESNVYRVLEKIVDKIFKMENDISKITIPLWKNSLTNIKDFDSKKPYNLLVKVISNWRQIFGDEEKKQQASEYLNKRIGASLSYVSDQNSLFFRSYFGGYGIIYDIDSDAFISASSVDAHFDELVGEDYPKEIEVDSFNPIRKVYEKGENSFFADATKIATPLGVINQNSEKMNEVIVDSSKIKPIATFYLKFDKTMPNSPIFETYEQDKLSATQLAQKLNIPVIELNKQNTLKKSQALLPSKETIKNL